MIYFLFAKLTTKNSDFQHLEFTSCGQISIGSTDLINWFKQYEWLFSFGFDHNDYYSIISLNSKITNFIQPCINNYSNFQFKALNETIVIKFCDNNNFSNSDKETVLKFI